MTRRPPRSTRTDTLFPYTTLFRSPATRASLRAAIGDTPPSGVARDPQSAGFRLQSLHWTTKNAAAQYRTSTGAAACLRGGLHAVVYCRIGNSAPGPRRSCSRIWTLLDASLDRTSVE